MSVVTGKEVAMNVAACVKKGAQIQPAGLELTVRAVSEFEGNGVIGFHNDVRWLPSTQIIDWDEDNAMFLDVGAYLVDLNEIVSIPADKVGIALPRSSLLRMGVTLGTALWDPGYSGHGQVLLIVHNPEGFVIYKDARILQLVLLTMTEESKQLYNGIYQGR